jgi:chaperonin GroEL
VQAAKELHFNKNMEALKRMQAGVDKLATVVGVTIGPKVRDSDTPHRARAA